MTESNNPTQQQLNDSWITTNHLSADAQRIYGDKSVMQYWHDLADQYGKQMIFTEIGYASADGANKAPGWLGSSDVVDTNEQNMAYKSLFNAVENYGGKWLAGAFLWSYQGFKDSSPADGVAPTDYTPQGKPANDTITANYSSPEHVTGVTLTGAAGADNLQGGYNNDTISGGAGNDTIWGGKGNDTLTGGAGADHFQFESDSGKDTIKDFDPTQDVIELKTNVNGMVLGTFTDLQSHMTQVGNDTVIDLGAGASITLTGVMKGALTASDFVFN